MTYNEFRQLPIAEQEALALELNTTVKDITEQADAYAFFDVQFIQTLNESDDWDDWTAE